MVIRKSFYISILAITVALLSAWPLKASAQPSRNIETAKAWLTALHTSRLAYMAMFEENMASDGVVVVNNRFVGFGMMWSGTEEVFGVDAGSSRHNDYVEISLAAKRWRRAAPRQWFGSGRHRGGGILQLTAAATRQRPTATGTAPHTHAK